MAKQKKPSAVMARPNSTWFQNALKSVGAASGDIIKELLPYTSESASNVMGVAKDVRNTIRKSAATGRTVTGQLEKNNLIQMGRNALKNAADDLKSGKLYNSDRGVDFGGDFNFDDIDMSFGDSDEADESSYGDNTVINNVNTIDSSAVLAVRDSVNNQTNATIAGATATVNTIVAATSNMMMANQKNMGDVISHLNNIDTNIASMLTYMNENVTKYIEASIAHYQEVAPVKSSSTTSTSDDKATSETVFGSSGFNASEYVKYVKQNIKNSTVGGAASFLKEMAPMLMGGVVSNPIGTIMTALGKSAISKDFKKSLAEFDKSIQSFIPTMLERIADHAYDYSDDGGKGTLMRMLGSVLGVRTTTKNEFARRKYEAGVTPFDNETKLAITEVIPSYLRDILSEISGNEKQVFDKSEMKFRNMSELQNEIYGDIYTSIVNTFKRSDFGKKIDDRQNRLNDSDQKKFEDLVNRLYLGISRSTGEVSGETIGSEAALTKYLAHGDSNTLKELKKEYGPLLDYLAESLNGMSSSEKASLNFTKIRARQSRNSKQREMEAAPELYNLNLVNDGMTIDQGMDEFHQRYYSKSGNAVVSGTSGNRRYTPKGLMQDVASIKSVLYRGINVKIVDELKNPSNGNDGPKGSSGGESAQPAVGSSVAEARRSIADDDALSAELAEYDREPGTATKGVNTLTNFMNAMINGGPSAASDIMSQAIMDGFSKAGNWLNEHIFDPMSKTIFGDKQKNPDDKGLFGGIRDSFSDMINGTIHSLTGKGYTKKNPADGEDAVVADSENSLAHKARDLFNNIKEGAAEYLFGKKDEEDGKRKGGFVGMMKEKLSDGLEGWCDMVFGKSKEGEPKSTEKMKKYIGKALPSALGGHVAGTMISSLMGGSILGNAIAPGLGGLIGSTIGLVSKSERFKNWLFGHEDKDGKYIRGVLSKKTQQTLKESKNVILGGGALGLLKGILLPSAAGATGAGLLTSFVGGPVAGMLMGAGLGMVKKSTWFQEMMYGKDDGNGKHINGLKDKLKNFFSKNMGKSKNGEKTGNAGGGYKGGMAIIGGLGGAGLMGMVSMPLLGGIMGAGLGILNSSDKFRKMMFGDIDEETGKRKGNGLVGKVGMWMNVNVMEPLKYGAEYVKTKMEFAGKRLIKGFSDMLDPLKTRLVQIKDSIVDKLTDFRHGVAGVIKTVVLKPLKKATEVALVPLKFIGKQGAKLGTALLKAPMDALSLVFRTMTKNLNLKNIKGYIKDGWKHAKRAIGDTIKRGLHGAANAVLSPVKTWAKNTFGKGSAFGNWATKWLSPVRDALVDGAKGIMSWIKTGVKKVLGFPFKLLGWAISAPFKLLGKAVGAVGKVARTGIGLAGIAMNARESDENGNAVGPGMRDKLKASLDEKAQEWAKKTGRDASEYGGPRKWLDTLKLIDPGHARLDEARRNGEIRDTVEVVDHKTGKTRRVKLNDAIDEDYKKDKEAEQHALDAVNAKYHLGSTRFRAKLFGYDPTKKEQILGKDRAYDDGEMTEKEAKAREELKKTQEYQDDVRTALQGSQDTVNDIAEVVKRGGEPGSIYTNDVHSTGVLQSIYSFLVKRFAGVTVSNSDLDDIANPHLNDGIVSDVTSNIFENSDEPSTAELATPSTDVTAADTIKNAVGNGGGDLSAWLDYADSVSNGDNAIVAMRNAENAKKDAESDKERNEKAAEVSAAGLEKAQNAVKEYREAEAARKEKDKDGSGEKTQTSLLRRLLNTTKEHTKSWFQTFDLKKGVITAGLIAIAPMAIKLIGSLMNGSFFSNIASSIGTTVNNVISNFFSNGGLEGAANGAIEVGGRAVKFATFDSSWNKNSNGDVDNLGSSVTRYVTKNSFKIANNALAGFAKGSGSKIITNTAKSLAGTGGVTKAVGGVTKTISTIIGKFVKWLGEKFPKVGSKAAEKIAGKMTGEVVEKVAAKGGAKIVGAAAAKTVSAAVSFGASELVWMALGAVDGAVKAAQLFEVRECDVDANMRWISTAFCALLGTTVGTVLDIIASVAEAIIGTNFIHEAAQFVWNSMHTEDERQMYKNMKESFKDDWRQDAYKKYVEQAGSSAMSEQQFMAMDDASIANTSGETLSDYNNSTNKDMLGHIGDWFKGIGNWFGETFGGKTKKSAVNTNAELIDTKWTGGVVKGTEPRLTVLSPGEIVYNPAGPEKRAYQRKREEAVRDKIYSRLSINADADELGSESVSSSISYAENSPAYTMLKKMARSLSSGVKKLTAMSANTIVMKNILYGMYSTMTGTDTFSYKSDDIRAASKKTKGILIDSIANIQTVFDSILDALGLNNRKVKVKDENGNTFYVNKDEASKYTTVKSGSGRGKAESDGTETTTVGNAKLYQQEDPAWNSPKYQNLDIGESGCGPTAASIAASVYGSRINPVQAAAIVNQTGNRDFDGGTMPQGIEAVGKATGVDMHEGPVSEGNIKRNLSQGKPVILMGQDDHSGHGKDVYGDGMHYVVGTQYDPRTGSVQILDPMSNKPKRRKLRDFIGNTESAIYTRGRGRYGRRKIVYKPFSDEIDYEATKYENIVEDTRNEDARKERLKQFQEENEWMSNSEKSSFALGITKAKRSSTLPSYMTDENVIYSNSYKQVSSHKNDPGYEWFREVDNFWKNEYSKDGLYDDVKEMGNVGNGFEPMWMSFSNLDKNYGISGKRWKPFYKSMANAWLLSNDRMLTISTPGTSVESNPVTIENSSNVKDQTKENALEDIMEVFKEMKLKPDSSSNKYDVIKALSNTRMKLFINVEFGKYLVKDLIKYSQDSKVRPYIKPMVEYCNKMDAAVISFVSMSNKDIDSAVIKNTTELVKIVCSGSFGANKNSLTSLYSLFTSNTSVAKYLAKHFSYFKTVDSVKKFTMRILNDIPSIETPVDIGTPDYLKGKTLTVIGNLGQCELIRLTFDKFNKLKYSNTQKDAIASGYANSATAIAYLYTGIGLPIPADGMSMYLSGKAISPLVTNTSDDEFSLISSASEDDIVKALYAGDVLLYRDSKDKISSAVRHVEMYAGDGLMIGHSGGTNGSVMGFHASKFRKKLSNLSLCAVRRFVKMADTTVYTMVMDLDKGIITQDGEDVTSTKTSLFEKITSLISEVSSRIWNGLLTGEWDTDFTDFWQEKGFVTSDANSSYAADNNDLSNEMTSYLSDIFENATASNSSVPLSDIVDEENDTSLEGCSEAEESEVEEAEAPDYGAGRPKRWRLGGRGRRKRYGRGNDYTASGETTVLPKGLGWYSVNEGWNAITAPSPQLELKNKAKSEQGSLYDNNGYAKYKDRYVVATTQTFGDAGDYIDIEQSDGNTIPAVIGDIKAWGVDSLEGRHVNKWGHNDGDVVLEFLKDSSANSFKWNPTDPDDPMYTTLHGKTVSSITNRGSVFTNASPIVPSNVRSRMSYSITKHSGTNGANTLSPLSEGYEEWAKENGVAIGNTCPSGESVYGDSADAIYKSAPRPDGTSAYAGADASTSTGTPSSSSSSNAVVSTNSSGSNNITTIIGNTIGAVASHMKELMLTGETGEVTQDEIMNGYSGNFTSSGSSSRYSADRYYLYPEDDGQGALPDSLVQSNSEIGQQIAEDNVAKTSSNRKALYDPTEYKSSVRADGWFLNNMPYSYKSSSFGEDFIDPETGRHLWDPCHKGIDIAAGIGTPIYTPVDGTITSVEPEKKEGSGFGNYVTIVDSRKKYHHIFAHQSQFADGIAVGDAVKRGELIGYVGETGYATGPHLHYQIDASTNGNSYINPNSFPFSIYNKTDDASDINETEHNDTSNIDESKGGRSVRDPLRVYSSLKKEIDNAKVEANRSKRDKRSESFNKSYGKGGESPNAMNTTRLEKLTETMIDILNTIADNTLSSSEKLDNIKSSAINMKIPSSQASKRASTSPTGSTSAGSMSSNERFARQIARGI